MRWASHGDLLGLIVDRLIWEVRNAGQGLSLADGVRLEEMRKGW